MRSPLPLRAQIASKKIALWICLFVSYAGDEFTSLSLTFLLAESAGGGIAVGALLAGQLMPRVIVGPWAGALSDRFDPRRVLRVSAGLQACVVASMALVVDHWIALVILATVSALVGAATGPAVLKIVSILGAGEQNLRLQGAVEAAGNAALLVGPALGGLMVVALGAQAALVVDAMTFGLVALLLGLVVEVQRQEPDSDDTAAETNHSGFALPILRSSPQVSRLLPAVGFAFAASAATNVAFVFLALRISDVRSELVYGLLAAAWGAGSLICSALVTAGVFGKAVVGWAVAVMGLALCAPALTLSIPALFLMWLIGGAANALVNVGLRSEVTSHTRAPLHGRAFGELGRLVSLTVGSGIIVGSFVAEREPLLLYGLGGGATALAGVITVLRPHS